MSTSEIKSGRKAPPIVQAASTVSNHRWSQSHTGKNRDADFSRHNPLVFGRAFPNLSRMLKPMMWGFLFAVGAAVQTASAQVELANMREDLRGVVQRVGELSLRVEQLERENTELRGKAGSAEKS